MTETPSGLSFPQVLLISEITLLLSQIVRAVVWSYDREGEVFYFGPVALDISFKVVKLFVFEID